MLVLTSDVINNSGVWGQSPQPPEANVGLWVDIQRCCDLQFFPKNKALLCIFWSNFCLEKWF